MANSCTSEECRAFLGGGSKHVSKHEPFQAPNPHRSFRYSTPENYVKIGLRNKSPLSAEPVIKSFYISVFHSLQIASNLHTISYNGNCIHVQMAWVQNRGLDFGSPDHLASFSFFTSNNRKTASISSGRSKLLISSSCGQGNPLSILKCF